MYNEVISNEYWRMTLSWTWSWPACFWPEPCHYLKIENVQVIEVIFSIPTSKDKHLGSFHQVGSVTVPTNWSSGTLWPLIPCHSDRIQCMQVSECDTLVSLSSKDYNSWPCQDWGVRVSWWGRCPLDLWLDPPACVQVQHMSVVQVNISLLLSSIVVTLYEVD